MRVHVRRSENTAASLAVHSIHESRQFCRWVSVDVCCGLPHLTWVNGLSLSITMAASDNVDTVLLYHLRLPKLTHLPQGQPL